VGVVIQLGTLLQQVAPVEAVPAQTVEVLVHRELPTQAAVAVAVITAQVMQVLVVPVPFFLNIHLAILSLIPAAG
jgi:hypothetical protein